MHCNIYEISKKPIHDDERLREYELPDWFVGTIAEYIEGELTDEQREQSLSAFASRFRSSIERSGDEICLSPMSRKAISTLRMESSVQWHRFLRLVMSNGSLVISTHLASAMRIGT